MNRYIQKQAYLVTKPNLILSASVPKSMATLAIVLKDAELGRVTERVMTKQGSAPYKIAEGFKMECEQFGIQLPEDFVKVPEYEQMRLFNYME